MQIRIAPTTPTPFNPTPLNTALPVAFAVSQDTIICPQAPYNSAYNATFPADTTAYVRIQDTNHTFTPIATAGSGVTSIKVTKGGIGYNIGQLNNGIITGAAWVTGHSGTALSFNGANNNVLIADNESLKPSTSSVVAWVNLRSAGTHYDSTPLTKGWTTFVCGFENSATPRIAFRAKFTGDPSLTELYSDTTQPLNTWIHVAYTYDGTQMKIYVNGVNIKSLTKVGTINWNTDPIMIGANSYGGHDFSIIDEVQLFNRAISQIEIMNLFNNGASVVRNGLVGEWLFNEGTGTTANDTSGGSNNGRIIGATWAVGRPSTTIIGITVLNPGSGYTYPPTVTIAGSGTGATAIATIGSSAPLSFALQPKAIQELFTADYGRMNSTLGVEIPNTNITNQTTLPMAYIDPPTEIVRYSDIATPIGAAADGTQLWKITHNGVDTHAIHVHMFNAQIINRIGWDGAIRPPDPNELGWKETMRMNPLEDIIIALRPITIVNLPFKLPNSVRLLDPTAAAGTTTQFTGIDPNVNPVTVTNALTNFGCEYVWHYHLLGHEENDMMRPMILTLPPDSALSGLSAALQASMQ